MPLKTGTVVGIKFTYDDGSTSMHGSWRIPHDSDYDDLLLKSESIGYTLLYEMAKQPSRTVVRAEIIDWSTKEAL